MPTPNPTWQIVDLLRANGLSGDALATATAEFEANLAATRKRELEHGLRAPAAYDTPVSSSLWKPEMTESANWAFGATKELLPTDTVVRFAWRGGPLCGRGGLAIRRSDKIVAELVRWRS